MCVIVAIPRIRERLLQERTEEYGYAYLLTEYHCLSTCDLCLHRIRCSTKTALWFLNKFRWNSNRLRAMLEPSAHQQLRAKVDVAYLQSSRLRHCLGVMASGESFDRTEEAMDDLADALSRMRAIIGSVLPIDHFGQRPEYSYANVESPAS